MFDTQLEKKTWEMILKSSSQKVPPAPLAIVERKTKLKLLGIAFEDDPVNWGSHIDHMLSKASSRLYILRVCSLRTRGGGYFPIRGYWGCAAGWGRIFTTGLTIMGLHF